jgi:hypothetical protein
LANCDINAIQRTVVLITLRLGSTVEASLTDDCVNTDGRLPGRSITDDQFSLAASNRDHRIDGHDASLHRLIHRLASDYARGHPFNRIKDITLNWPFSIDWFSERIHNPAQQTHTHGDLKQLACRPDFIPLLKHGVVAKNNHPDFSLLEVESESGDAMAQVKHLVEHRVAETFYASHAVAHFPNDAHVLLSRCGFKACNLGFKFL